MSEELLLVAKRDRICTITLNRPEVRNSLNPEMLMKLADALEALNDDSEIRVVVIRGAGDKSFSSGYDIGRISTGGSSGGGQSRGAAETRSPSVNPLQRGLDSIINYRYPVIAMIYGYAVGAGCDLASCCDFRFAADNARVGMTPAKLGLVYNHTGIQRFVDLVGVGGAKEIFLTGSLIDAPRAKEMGFLSRVVPASELESVTYAVAKEISENAPLSVSGMKTTINRLASFRRLSTEDEAALGTLVARAGSSEDLKEGQRAFLEKRKPSFQGR